MIATVIVVVIIEGSLEMIAEVIASIMIEEVIATIKIVIVMIAQIIDQNKIKSKPEVELEPETVQRKLSLVRKTKLRQKNFCLHFRLVNQNHLGMIVMWYHSKFDVFVVQFDY